MLSDNLQDCGSEFSGVPFGILRANVEFSSPPAWRAHGAEFQGIEVAKGLVLERAGSSARVYQAWSGWTSGMLHEAGTCVGW